MRSFRDPENQVVETGGIFYRVATGESARDLSLFIQTELCAKLQAEGWLPDFAICSPDVSQMVIRSRNEKENVQDEIFTVFRVETLTPITYPWEWGSVSLYAAGRFLLELRKRLLQIDFDLKDASAHNVSFINGKPMLIDLGSLITWRGNPHWVALRQFTEHFINPLLASKSGIFSVSDLWRMSPLSGVKSLTARRLATLRDRCSPRIMMMNLIARSPKRESGGEVQLVLNGHHALAKRASYGQLRSLVASLNKVSQRRKKLSSTWSDYSSRSHYSDLELRKKLNLALEFANLTVVQGGRILDLGGNDGLVAQFVTANSDFEVIIVDDDVSTVEGSPDRANQNRKVTFVRADAMGVLNPLRVGPADFDPLFSRIKPSAVFCHAVIHHLVISQAVPLHDVVNFLRELGVPVQVEFVDENDQKVRQLIARIDNWNGIYTRDSFLQMCNIAFSKVEEVGRTTTNRFVVNLIP
jgi:hypothetical protein